ncbi:MAG TPA: ATP-binding cassette domain-containing protein [Myxococcota bacterium]|nr:ATP-binding cassette domain-containing protein [Myxococcota bacterium]
MSARTQVELAGVDVSGLDDPGRVLVRDVSWGIERGEWWAIGGGPASGKSALLSVAAGLSPPVRGAVRIFGRDVGRTHDSEPAVARQEIGFVFESGGGLLGRLSVAENIALPLRYHQNLDPAQAQARVDALLRQAGLEGLGALVPSQLTVALRQRVALLRALAVPVQILFLDSPFRGLAPSGIRWWLEFLRELRARRVADGEPVSLITSSYDFHALREDAERFAVLERERFRVLEAAEEVAAYREDAGPPPQTSNGC